MTQIVVTTQVMDTWLAYAPVKNNPEDAAKVRNRIIIRLSFHCGNLLLKICEKD